MDKRVQVLYVDDEPDNLSVFVSRFKRVFNVITANSAVEGLALLKTNEFQVVISDHRMPEITGVQFLQQVRELYPDAMRIILTAYTDAEDIIDAINKGGVYLFVKKPWIGDEFKLLLDKTISFYNLRIRNKDLVHRLYTTINELEMFYYRVSHELRGPIATQLGLVGLAKEDAAPSNYSHYLRMIEDSIKKLDSTIQRIGSTHMTTQTGPTEKIDFNKIIDTVLERLKDEISGRSIEISIKIEEGIEYNSYESLVSSLLLNLVENGIFFSDPNKLTRNVTIDIKKLSEKEISVVVSDNGLGIEESQLEMVFSAFHRGNMISKGNGLGLYIVKKSVDNLGGKISITSEVNKGTNITITLPFEWVQEEFIPI